MIRKLFRSKKLFEGGCWSRLKESEYTNDDEFERGILILGSLPIQKRDLIDPNSILVYLEPQRKTIQLTMMWGPDSVIVSDVSANYAHKMERIARYAKANGYYIYPEFSSLKKRDAFTIRNTFMLVEWSSNK